MNLAIVTIALDAMPFIARHFGEFNKLKCNWHWYIVEGASSNNRDTSWCAKQDPRLSIDGTHEYLRSLVGNKRVTFLAKPYWNSKTSMVNSALSNIRGMAVVVQNDADEFWGAPQLDQIVDTFEANPSLSVMQFKCNYHVGPDIVTTTDDAYGNNPGEWVRAWRFRQGQTFDSHEPPVLCGNKGKWLYRNETVQMGLVFDHYAWVLEDQVTYKEYFYKYKGAVASWKRLQNNQEWPVKLKSFLPWVDDRAMATRVNQPSVPWILKKSS